MDCRNFELLVQKYHDGELDAAMRAEYESHLGLCRACRELDAGYASVFEALEDLPLAEPSPAFDAAVMSRVDVTRYRTSVARRAAAAVRGGWDWLPKPVRVSTGILAVFGLFTAVYTPILGMLAAAARDVFAFIGSGLFIARRIIEDPSIISKYLATSTNYKLAVRILLETFEKQISGMQVSHLAIAGLSAAVIVVLVVRATRIAWSKGETHVSII